MKLSLSSKQEPGDVLGNRPFHQKPSHRYRKGAPLRFLLAKTNRGKPRNLLHIHPIYRTSELAAAGM